MWGALRRGGGIDGVDLWQSFARHQAVFWGAVAITLAAAAAACVLQQPLAEAQIRVSVVPSGQPEGAQGRAVAAMRQALEGASLRIAALDAVGWGRVFPDLDASADTTARDAAVRRLADLVTIAPADGSSAEDRRSLSVRMRHRDAGVAADYDAALVVALLARNAPAPTSTPVVTSLTGPRDVLVGMRARAAADLAAADRRAAVLSDGLTDTAHDMVSALRATSGQGGDVRPPAADVLDQGRVLMAELQLKRLQVASKYQDDFPAVTALDGEIEKLRAFLAGEQKRTTVPRSPAANPVLETLGAERRRLGVELDEENARRVALRDQLATLDRQIAAAVPPPMPSAAAVVAAPVLVAGSVAFLSQADPRLLSLPAILLVGLLGAGLLQWAMLRGRTTIATVAEAEAILGLPVLRCLDVDGHPIGGHQQNLSNKKFFGSFFQKRTPCLMRPLTIDKNNAMQPP